MAIKSTDLSKYGFSAANQAEVLRQRDAHERRLGQTGEPITKAAQVGVKGKGNKYHANRTWSARWETWFDSKAECQFADEVLWPRFMAGEIQRPRFHQRVLIAAGIYLKVDYVYFDNMRDGLVWCEFKGKEMADWRLKKKLWAQFGPGLLLVVKKGNRAVPWQYEQITPAAPQPAEAP